MRVLKAVGWFALLCLSFTWRFLDVVGRSDEAMKLPELFDGMLGFVIAHQDLGYRVAPWFFMAASVVGLIILQWPELLKWKHNKPTMLTKDKSVSQPYLSHRDSEMTHAIEGMAFRSAWGRWYPSQILAKDKNYLVQDKHNQDHLMMIATSVVTDAAVNGKLEIRGRPRNSRKYETIPREDWRLIFLHPEPDIRTIWQVAIRPRSDVSTERIAELLEYDSLIVDSEKFEKLWPRNEAATDALRLKNLQAAKENGNAQSEIDKLM